MIASDIIDRARRQLHDLKDQNDNPLVGQYRWPDSELLLYVNDGMREIVMHRPDSTATLLEGASGIPLVAGTRQSVPAGYTRLIEIVRNSAGNKRAIRVAQRDDMDRWLPTWHNDTGTEVKNYVYDERDPKRFWVHPGATGTTQRVDGVLAKDPAPVSTLGATLDTDDIYMNPLLNYVLFRALTRDIEGNAYNRGVMFYQQFADAMGIKTRADMMISPNMATTQRMVE